MRSGNDGNDGRITGRGGGKGPDAEEGEKTEPVWGQIFRPSTNTLFRLVLVLPVLALAGLAWGGYVYFHSPYVTHVGIDYGQPAPFSHKHHNLADRMDCRYCHFAVESSPSAGMPSSELCMTCHSQLWKNTPALAPVVESYEKGIPLEWNRVHRLPDHVYFNHSIHVNKGVACVTCHGHVEEMPILHKSEPMTMSWCLECHTHPEKFIRPREEVFNANWHPPVGSPPDLGQQLVKKYQIEPARLVQCYTCHR